jgi:hypothetical protein
MHGYTEHHRRLVTTFVVLATIGFSVLLLASALAGRHPETGAVASGTGDAALKAPAQNSVSLPNLNDACVRQQFVDSFGAGSFGIPPQASTVVARANDADSCARRNSNPATPRVDQAPRLPNLDDSATRRRFACSFASGSFASVALPHDLEGGLDCG